MYLDNYLINCTVGELKNILIKIGGTPSTKNKAQLIEAIHKIQNGEQVPVGSKRGRPRKADRRDKYDGLSELAHYSVHDHCPETPNVCGILEINDDGYGVLHADGYAPNDGDVLVSRQTVADFDLRSGDKIIGLAKIIREDAPRVLAKISSVNDKAARAERGDFSSLRAIYSPERLKIFLRGNTCCKIADLVAPIGKGQRGLIIASSDEEMRSVVKSIAQGLIANNRNLKTIILLVNARPEDEPYFSEVGAEVVLSRFDEPYEQQAKTAELVMERAKRLVECRENVCVIVYSLTNLFTVLSRTAGVKSPTSGGAASATMPIKKLFGSALNAGEASLTIIGALRLSESVPSDAILAEELTPAANAKLVLSAEQFRLRNLPAIDLAASGNVIELLSEQELAAERAIRRMVDAPYTEILKLFNSAESVQELIEKLNG